MTQLGKVLVGTAPGRQSEDDVTSFDSTGLAIALAAMEHADELDPPTLDL